MLFVALPTPLLTLLSMYVYRLVMSSMYAVSTISCYVAMTNNYYDYFLIHTTYNT